MTELAKQPVLIKAVTGGGQADGAALGGAAANGTAVDGAAVDSAALNGVALDGAAEVGAAVNIAALNGVALDGAAADGAAVQHAVVEEPQAEELLNSGADDLALLQPDDEVETLADRLGKLNMIALNFPAFNDGRPYSTASKLRQQGFTGEIRAIGDVRVDQLEQMVRCGFNAFELAEGQPVQLALEQLAGFSHSYQLVADRQPLFRKRQ